MKILFLHQANIGSESATGQLLDSLISNNCKNYSFSEIAFKLSEYPSSKLISFYDISRLGTEKMANVVQQAICFEKPDLIIFRPDERLIHLSDLVISICKNKNIKILLSFMDVWFENNSLRVKDLIANGDGIWYISKSIKEFIIEFYKEAKKVKSFILANGVDRNDYLAVKLVRKDQRVFNFNFFGSINEHQTYEGLYFFSSVLENYSPRCFFNIYSRQHNTILAKKLTEFKCVKVNPSVSKKDYFKKINGSDALIIPYGFSSVVVNYLKYSFGNKIPEFLATGLPILAIGSKDLNSIKFLLNEVNCKCIVNPDDVDSADRWISRIIDSYYEEWSSAFHNKEKYLLDFDIFLMRDRFNEMIMSFK